MRIKARMWIFRKPVTDTISRKLVNIANALIQTCVSYAHKHTRALARHASFPVSRRDTFRAVDCVSFILKSRSAASEGACFRYRRIDGMTYLREYDSTTAQRGRCLVRRCWYARQWRRLAFTDATEMTETRCADVCDLAESEVDSPEFREWLRLWYRNTQEVS